MGQPKLLLDILRRLFNAVVLGGCFAEICLNEAGVIAETQRPDFFPSKQRLWRHLERFMSTKQLLLLLKRLLDCARDR
ncbi:hypothetical protein GJAV_G00107810 [Gymnothorax javanicus]|nr:hypothetical protein GJAV_G00107810 [Gymnothorax javanicus]